MKKGDIRGRRAFVILFSFLILILVGNASAMSVVVLDGTIDKIHPEGDVVEYTLKISGVQPQVSEVELETDLQPYGQSFLWNITDPGFLELPDDQSQFQDQSIRFGVNKSVTAPVLIHVTGQVPQITEIVQSEGLVITKTDAQTTGYTHYRVQFFDEDGFVVGNAFTEVFDIEIPDETDFFDRLSSVQDPLLRGLVIDLHDKGLKYEANTLLDYSDTKPMGVSLPLVIVILVVIGGIALFAGYRIGYARGHNAGINEND